MPSARTRTRPRRSRAHRSGLQPTCSDFAEAGADELILVVNPISERSIRALAPVLALVRSA